MADTLGSSGAPREAASRFGAVGWGVAGATAIFGASALWFMFADAVFVGRILSALASCF